MSDTLDAPYNFVPLSGHVFLPDWARDVHQDLPLERGLSGRIRYRIRVDGPIVVGGAHEEAEVDRPGRVSFFRLPDGAFAIPGTSVRGMIRNVLEIAAFGKMQLVDDRRYSLRDLTGPVRDEYGARMTEKVERGGRSTFAARSRAGWLRFDTEAACWKLRPCSYGRITHNRIAELAEFAELPAREFGQPPTTAMDKYRLWQRQRGSPEVEVVTGDPQGSNQLAFTECYLPKERSGQTRSGTLVFTGQPNSKKRREFVFFDEKGQEVAIPQRVMAAFLDVHEGPTPSREWEYWRDLHYEGEEERIPVFFLQQDENRPLVDSEQVDAFGLAMMFKLASRHSTHDLRARASGKDGAGDPHADADTFDLAELIFGRVHKDRADLSLRGRASFGIARLSEPADARPVCFGPNVLGTPKPSWFPAYLRQPLEPAAPSRLPSGESYRTWMTKGAELAGWKRYPVHAVGERPALPTLSATNERNRKVQIEVEALDGGDRPLVFEGWLRFHNLLPEEFGALVWCIEWGDRATLRHKLGLARFAGFGSVAMTLDRASYEAEANDPDAVAPGLDDCAKAFRHRLEAWAGAAERRAAFPRGWEQSLQIARLLAMADPAEASRWPARLEHMILDPQARPNAFVAAKSQRLVLAPYGEAALERERPPITPRRAPQPVAGGEQAAAPHAQRAHRTEPEVLRPAGTEVEFAGERGRLTQPLRRGMREVEVDFAGEIERVPVAALDLPGPPR